MATSSRDLKRRLDQQKADQDQELQQQSEEQLEAYGHDMGPERASALQSQVGNTDLQEMLAQSGSLEQDEELVQEEEQSQEQDQDQEQGEGSDLEGALGDFMSMAGSSMGQEGHGASVEDLGLLFGGDADDDPPPKRARRTVRFVDVIPSVGMRSDDDEQPAPRPHSELDLPRVRPSDRSQGDERFDALWGWLQDPAEAVGADLRPEDLVDAAGHLMICGRLAGFWQAHARDGVSRALARTAGPGPGDASLAATVARTAALLDLAGVIEGQTVGVEVANRAAAIALEWDAPAWARHASKKALQERNMRADHIVEIALDGEAGGPLPKVEPGALGRLLMEAGVAAAVEAAPIPDPENHAIDFAFDGTSDDSTADIDALLYELTGAAPPPLTVLDDRLQPLLDGMRRLMLFAGRTQVELAAAGIAVRRAAGGGIAAALSERLGAADNELRRIARRTSVQEERTRALSGAMLHVANAELGAIEATLRGLTARLRALRETELRAIARVAAG